LTHRSLELTEPLQKVIDFEQRSLGVGEPYTWASVHRIHHQMTDVSLFPFYRIYHAIHAAEEKGIAVDKKKMLRHLDPFVKEFDFDSVIKLGEEADKFVQERMKDLYAPPAFADNAAIQRALNPTEPQYWYPEGSRKHSREEYVPDEIARILLTDPHSPALIKRENGVQGVAVSNINLYQHVADVFRYFPEVKPIDLQRDEDFVPKDEPAAKRKKIVAFTAGFVLPSAVMFLANKDYSMKGLGRAVLEGTAINGIRAGTELFGGNVTNSAGHMGDPIQTELAKAMLSKRYEIKLKPDGTIATNTVGKGVVGRLASWATLDEVGGQQVHHESPWKIKYTDEEGREAIIEAPWGSLLEYLAKNENFPFIKFGKGFVGSNDQRPDVVHPAVKRIQQARATEYQSKLACGEIEEDETHRSLSGGITRVAKRIRTIFPT
jgi:hypothetical protein